MPKVQPQLFHSPHNFSLSPVFTTGFHLPRLFLQRKFPTLLMDAAVSLPNLLVSLPLQCRQLPYNQALCLLLRLPSRLRTRLLFLWMPPGPCRLVIPNPPLAPIPFPNYSETTT